MKLYAVPVAILSILVSTHADAGIVISPEVEGGAAADRAAAESNLDSWKNSFSAGTQFAMPNLFGSATDDDATGTAGFTTMNSAGTSFSHQLDWSVGIMNVPLTGGNPSPTSADFVPLTRSSGTGGSVTYAAGGSMQGNAPIPDSYNAIDGLNSVLTSGWTGTNSSGATVNSNDGLEALRLDFGASTDGIFDFGFFMGDVESRSAGTVGGLLMYDVNGNLIDDQDIVYGNLNGTNYSETTSTGAAGVVNNTTDQWGNNSSAFVSFSSSVAIGEVFLFVGDDDENDTGSSEHLSISGLKFAAAVPEPSGFLFLGLIGLISAGFRRWNNK